MEVVEDTITNLVNSRVIWAKINRLNGVISFKKPLSTNETLNSWAQDLNRLLGLVISVNHLINKEEMIGEMNK